MFRLPAVIALLFTVAIRPACGQEWSRLLQTADSLFERHAFDAAIRTGFSALAEAETTGAATDTIRGLIAHRMGLYHWLAGALPRADSFLTQAEKLRERALGARHPDLARTIMNHSVVYGAMGDHLAARRSLLRSLEVRPDSPFVAAYLNLGNNYLGEGDYAAAEYYFNEAVAVQQRLHPGDDILRMQCLFALGYFRLAQGYYGETVRLNEEALVLARRTLGEDHYWTRNILTNLTAGYGNLGRTRDALATAKEDLRVQSHYPDDPARRLHTQLNIGVQYHALGELDSAEALADALLRGLDSLGGLRPGHSHFVTVRAGIAEDRGDLRAADSLFGIALGLWGRESPTLNVLTQTPQRASAFYRRNGRPGAALAVGRTAMNRWRNAFPGVVARASDRDARAYAGIRADALSTYLSAFVDGGPWPDSSVRETADLILSTKGAITESHFQRHAAWRERLDAAGRTLQAAYEDLQARVAGLFVESLTDSTARGALDSARREMGRAENDLARVSGEFQVLRDESNVTASNVAAALPAGAVAVEYLRYRFASLSPDTLLDHYLAVVVSGDGAVSVRDLGPADPVDQDVLRYRRHFSGLRGLPGPAAAADYRRIARGLHLLVWAPLESAIGTAPTVMVSPDGGLNLVSFAGLEDPSSRYLIQRHALQTLTATRDLLRFRDRESGGGGLLAVADPAFSEPAGVASSTSAPGRAPHERVFRSACLDTVRLQPLPYSRDEVEAVRRSWVAGHRSGGARVLAGSRANEEQFRKLSTGNAVLHLATHGFFLHGGCGASPAAPDPLLQSGLFLAGGAVSGSRRSAPDQDGILTALELSSLDLRGTDLVVLSACETGLGEPRQGEGVYGLRRALQMAGVRTVVSTLWKVPDLETMKFMKLLYAADARSYPEVMRTAALRMIRDDRLRNRPRHPLTWGAFVATGDWRMPRR